MPSRPNFPIPENIHAPLCCLQIQVPDDPTWKSVVAGLLYELQYWFNWQRDDANSGKECAAVWKKVYLDIDWNLMACKSNDCCQEPAIIKRINPTTGNIEQSIDGGTTWTPAPGGLSSFIVQPIPPVTSGVAATKCDAATNLAGQVDVWIDQVSNDFTTAVSLLEFGTAVLEAILVAVVTILSLGTLTAVEALILPTIAAALYAAWGAGKSVFDAYWSTENKNKILCAAFCNIGDDGSFTDEQFSSFWNDCNSDLPPSPAKMLFMGFLSSVSAAGVNAMAATGLSADSDCADCDCGVCEVIWAKGNIDGNIAFGTVTSLGAGLYRVQSQLHTDGVYYAEMLTPSEVECCHVVSIVANTGGSLPSTGTSASRIVCPNPQHVGNVTSGDMITADTNFNYIAWNSGNAFDILIQFD